MMQFPVEFPVNILLLGAGELGKELTISLQRLGCKVTAVDTYANAPAMSVATNAKVVTMTDEAELARLIAEIKPDLIVPEVEKLAVDALIKAEQAGIKVVPSAPIVQLTFDRNGIRTLAAKEAQVPTSPYEFADSLESLTAAAEKIGFPCFVKPTMSSSGHGQSRVISSTELPQAWEAASNGARAETGRVIVEGEVKFDYEITLLTIRSLNYDGEVCTSFCAPIGHKQKDGDYVESWQPQEMPQATLEKAQNIAKAVTDALARKSADENQVLGLFGVELFIVGEEVIFSELSPRPHDTGMVTLATQRQSEFDLHARAILGLPVDPSLQNPGASYPIKSPIETTAPRYCGIAETLSDSRRAVRIFGKPEAHCGRRMAVVTAFSEDVYTARQLAAQHSVEIIDGAAGK